MDEKTLSEIEGRDGAAPARLAEAGYGVVYEDRRALVAEVRRLRAELDRAEKGLSAMSAILAMKG